MSDQNDLSTEEVTDSADGTESLNESRPEQVVENFEVGEQAAQAELSEAAAQPISVSQSEAAQEVTSTENEVEEHVDNTPPEATLEAAQPEPGQEPDTIPADEVEEKKKGLGPRWSYIIVRGSIVACIWAFFTYAFDPLLKIGLVSSAESAAGAKVDVGGFSTNLFPPRVTITDFAMANQQAPSTNLFEFAQLDGRVSGTALLKGNYVIDEATLTGLRWDTKRSTSGKLEETEELEPVDDGPGLADKAKNVGKEWANGLLDRVKLDYDPNNYESVRLATRYEDEWKTDFDDLETRVKGVDGQYKKLRDLIKNAKGKPLERIRAYDQVRIHGTKLLRDLNKMKVDLASLPTKARTDLGTLNSARQRDTAEIQSKVKNLFDGNGDDLSEFLLGPELHHRVERGLSWFKWADGRVDEFQNRPKPKRFRGEDIHFETLEPLPEYLVRLVNISGSGVIGGDQLALEGTIRDIASDPIMHGKPIVMRMEGKGEGLLRVKSTFDRTKKDVATNQFEFDYALPRVIEQKLGDDDSLVVTVTAQHTRWHGKILTQGDAIQGTVSMVQTPVSMIADLNSDVDERLRNIVGASVSKIRRIDAIVRISGTIKKPKLKLETNLGQVISEGVKEGLQEQLSTEKEALIAKLNASFSEKQNGLVKMFNSQREKVTQSIQTQENGIQSLIPRIGANNGLDLLKRIR
jgi:uncharacterized protein (TIGR03545 family)